MRSILTAILGNVLRKTAIEPERSEPKLVPKKICLECFKEFKGPRAFCSADCCKNYAPKRKVLATS